MKSPWKMIGWLISRRRSPEEEQEPTENIAESSTNADRELEAVAPSSTPEQAYREPHHDDIGTEDATGSHDDGGVGEEATIPFEKADGPPAEGRERTRRGKRREAIVSEIASTTRVGPLKRRGRKKSASIQPAARKTGAPPRRMTPSGPAYEKFEAEVAVVDTEVRELSRQLAQKLKQQNAQRRKMLERFGET